jgi:hypothetical protein
MNKRMIDRMNELSKELRLCDECKLRVGKKIRYIMDELEDVIEFLNEMIE